MNIESEENIIVSDSLRPVLPEGYLRGTTESGELIAQVTGTKATVSGRLFFVELTEGGFKVSLGLDRGSMLKVLATDRADWQRINLLEGSENVKGLNLSNCSILLTTNQPYVMTIESVTQGE